MVFVKEMMGIAVVFMFLALSASYITSYVARDIAKIDESMTRSMKRLEHHIDRIDRDLSRFIDNCAPRFNESVKQQFDDLMARFNEAAKIADQRYYGGSPHFDNPVKLMYC